MDARLIFLIQKQWQAYSGKNAKDMVNSEIEADYVVVNSCAVKNKTQSKEPHYLRKISKNKKVIVWVCLTKTIDTNSLTKLPDILESPMMNFQIKKR